MPGAHREGSSDVLAPSKTGPLEKRTRLLTDDPKSSKAFRSEENLP